LNGTVQIRRLPGLLPTATEPFNASELSTVKKKIPLPLDFSCPPHPSFFATLNNFGSVCRRHQSVGVRGIDVSLAEELLSTATRVASILLPVRLKQKNRAWEWCFSTVWNEGISETITFGISLLKRLITLGETPVP